MTQSESNHLWQVLTAMSVEANALEDDSPRLAEIQRLLAEAAQKAERLLAEKELAEAAAKDAAGDGRPLLSVFIPYRRMDDPCQTAVLEIIRTPNRMVTMWHGRPVRVTERTATDFDTPADMLAFARAFARVEFGDPEGFPIVNSRPAWGRSAA